MRARKKSRAGANSGDGRRENSCPASLECGNRLPLFFLKGGCCGENFSLTPGFSRVCKARAEKTVLNGFSLARSWFTALKRGINEMISTGCHLVTRHLPHFPSETCLATPKRGHVRARQITPVDNCIELSWCLPAESRAPCPAFVVRFTEWLPAISCWRRRPSIPWQPCRWHCTIWTRSGSASVAAPARPTAAFAQTRVPSKRELIV